MTHLLHVDDSSIESEEVDQQHAQAGLKRGGGGAGTLTWLGHRATAPGVVELFAHSGGVDQEDECE